MRPVLLLGLAGTLALLLWRANRERAALSFAAAGAVGMSYAAKLRELMAHEEGSVPYVYKDSRGLDTFGVGHLLRPGVDDYLRQYTRANPAPQSLVEKLLAEDTSTAAKAVNALGVALSDAKRAALTSLAFNIGNGAFAGSSVARNVKAGNWQAAADAFLLWKRAGNDPDILLPRRQRERALFLSA